MKLSDKHRQRIIKRHQYSIQERGYEATALFWRDQSVQEKRFDILIDFIRLNSQSVEADHVISILDVGCGFGDLCDYLKKAGLQVNYTGIDVSPDMVRAGQFKHGDIHLLQGELFDFEWPQASFDWVVCSGAMNEVVDSPGQEGEYAQAMIQKMYALCRQGVVFNLLDASHEWSHSRPDLQSFDSSEIASFCKGFANNVLVRQDYLPNDFTVCLTRMEK
ncbi:class I SAM-dependent methyltransferase [Hydrogenovibrio sp. 3SP14C1]|uniref:class I SAM-dependent methyltransferase n=1 Tax=Hydrogenovibrio sp. 3SP14C1 TaxID=3038774 RepID=UPI002417AA40|nr:class I SAM-dependent methyltransferase [Hydrogenovibrio sp. 3SP14C1]MDG4813504.1 class I SAM-dependent methyltransferase [Hydrogenovibrio sp. 3SP14C1]